MYTLYDSVIESVIKQLFSKVVIKKREGLSVVSRDNAPPPHIRRAVSQGAFKFPRNCANKCLNSADVASARTDQADKIDHGISALEVKETFLFGEARAPGKKEKRAKQ